MMYERLTAINNYFLSNYTYIQPSRIFAAILMKYISRCKPSFLSIPKKSLSISSKKLFLFIFFTGGKLLGGKKLYSELQFQIYTFLGGKVVKRSYIKVLHMLVSKIFDS